MSGTLKCMYIGQRFYYESGTMLSSIYTQDMKRTDFGKIQIALEEGRSVEIRPATEEELQHFIKRLDEMKSKKEK